MSFLLIIWLLLGIIIMYDCLNVEMRIQKADFLFAMICLALYRIAAAGLCKYYIN